MTATVVSNCWLWARALYRRRLRAWIAAGMPAGQEPYWCKRPSRRTPRWLRHYLVGTLEADGRVRVCSLVPIKPTDVPAWLAWTHAWFEGVPTYDDRPEPWAQTEQAWDGDGATGAAGSSRGEPRGA
jgi:hypothetical protein